MSGNERSWPDRVEAAVLGLVAGDGLAWPSLWQRTSLLPERRRARIGTLWAFGAERDTTTVTVPYLHSTPFDAIDFTGPTDDTEWFVVTARHLMRQTLAGEDATEPMEIWAELAMLRKQDPASVRCRIGTLLALTNLQRHVQPPSSGRFNAHYFDDIGCVRALAAAILRPGRPAEAAALAQSDLEVTHALDGLWCAQGAAAFFAALLGDAPKVDATAAALEQLPVDSWSRNVVAGMLAIAAESSATLSLSAAIEHTVIDQIYSYPVIAPETLGLLLAHVAKAETAEELLMGAFSHPRHADALLPLTGSAAALIYGTAWLPQRLREEAPVLRGTSVTGLAGVSVLDVGRDLAGRAMT